MKKKHKLYRLTIVEDETHKRISAYRFSRLSAIIVSVCIVLILLGVAYCAIAFTPLRRAIPGYPDEYSKNIAVRNAIKIDSLENIITRWEFYAANLSAALGGDVDVNLEENLKNNSTKYLKDISEERMREADSLLREKVKKEKE